MSAEPEKQDDIQLRYESLGNIRYLVVHDNGDEVRERIPLHIFNMPDGTAKTWFLKDVVARLKIKMIRKKKQLIATVTRIKK